MWELADILLGGGNTLFFLLSAMLYGLKWSHNNYQPFPVVRFMIKKIIKLGASVWPFLFLVVCLYQISDVKFRFFDVVANTIFLGFIWKLPNYGHLWFLTVLMVCYVEFLLLSKKRIGWYYLMPLFLICMIIFTVLENLGIPAHYFLTFGLCGIVFCYADKIEGIGKCKRSVCFILVVTLVLFNFLAIFLFHNDLFDTNRIISFCMSGFCGLSWLLIGIIIMPTRNNILIRFLSKISFELYLIHLCFFQKDMSVLDITDNHFISFIFYIFFSVVSAYFLHLISSWFHKILLKLICVN